MSNFIKLTTSPSDKPIFVKADSIEVVGEDPSTMCTRIRTKHSDLEVVESAEEVLDAINHQSAEEEREKVRKKIQGYSIPQLAEAQKET